jgi:hypothetical protein
VSFKVGDRVRIRRELADGYIQPLRGWAERGRKATILRSGSWPYGSPSWLLRFDTARPPKWPEGYERTFRPDEIELIEGDQP